MFKHQKTLLVLLLLLSLLPLAKADLETSTSEWREKLVDAAHFRTTQKVVYDGRYISIGYPGGDVPKNIGVCTDVVIRSYRQLNVDLQMLVHLDMRENFVEYPKIWGLKRADRNIDHRRVPNLQRFFERQGASLAVSGKAEDYLPGDLVTWMLPGNLPHIGIVSDKKSKDGQRYLIVHNIGQGPKLSDFLFAAPVTGHYRYSGR